MKFNFSLAAGVAMTLLATSASAVDWGGYVRMGPGQKENSGDGKRCYNGQGDSKVGGADRSVFGKSGAPGHGGIGRLGNECHTYGEFALSQGMQAGGVNYKALVMTNFSSAGGSDASGLTTAVNQIYVESTGYDIAPNQTFWVGRRFYHRADVHWDDSFYVDMSGTGAGVDSINLGFGSLSVAAFRQNDVTSIAAGSNPATRLNLDLEGININPGGKLRVTAAFTDVDGGGGKKGYGLSLQHKQTGIFGGENTLFVQGTQGSAGLNMGFGNSGDGSDVKAWRIADSLAWLNGPLTAQTLIHFGQENSDIVGKAKSWSLGGRVAYAFTKNFKLQAELGHANNKRDGFEAENITKFTIAPTLTVGPNYYDRPELRFYVSNFRYNDAYKASASQSKSSKTAAGFQAEIWF